MALTRTEARSRLRRGGDKEAMESAGMMRWLLTYADMITLLLALFIILFAISNISAVKFNKLAHAISGGFDGTSAINNPPDGGLKSIQHGRAENANLLAVKAQLDKYIAQRRLQSKVQTRIDKQGLVITLLSDKTYYDSGSADLRPEYKQLLDVVAAQLRSVRNDVRVEGSTDNVPIATYAYPTNWELSAARATGVTRYLVEHAKIVPTRISFAGYGEFHPKFANDSDAHRQQNRRVDIVILNGAAAPTPNPEAQ
ncbi:MAG: OmpA/MotB domain protein [Candidatus Eremiobacteraeota bacterium]|nr:OmpA/MotB domain protein [Candidatus Eremiobacteraeota bacterium]